MKHIFYLFALIRTIHRTHFAAFATTKCTRVLKVLSDMEMSIVRILLTVPYSARISRPISYSRLWSLPLRKSFSFAAAVVFVLIHFKQMLFTYIQQLYKHTHRLCNEFLHLFFDSVSAFTVYFPRRLLSHHSINSKESSQTFKRFCFYFYSIQLAVKVAEIWFFYTIQNALPSF